MRINKRQIRAVFFVTALCCAVYAAGYGLESLWHEAQVKEQQRLHGEEQRGIGSASDRTGGGAPGEVQRNAPEGAGTGAPGESGNAVSGGGGILPELEGLYEQNKDLAGWISIEGTGIDYPVMHTGTKDFYLNHDFERKESRFGCLYLHEGADIQALSGNTIIFGHNMKDGSMFGDLDRYQDREFYEKHKIIRFDTLYERGHYEIVSVFLSKVYRRDEEAFKYYQVTDLRDEEEFDSFTDNIVRLSLYDTGVEPHFGDRYLTLSTCVYHVENGRIAVVARKIPGIR